MAVSTLTGSSDTPGFPTDLWAMAYLFLPNWQSEVVVRSEFTTSIKGAISTAEQRRGLRSIPIRSVAATFESHRPGQVADLIASAMRASTCGSLFPLIPDQTRLTSAVIATATSLPCVTTDRRFAASTRALVINPTSEPQAPTFEVVTIASLTGSALTISPGMSNGFPAGSIVVPLIEAGVRLDFSGEVLNDHVATLGAEAVERTGLASLPTVGTVGTNPSGFDTHGGYPILDTAPDYSGIKWGFVRQGSLSTSGIATVPTVYGSRAAGTFTLPFVCTTRAEAFDLIEFFESRGGQLHPFWLPSPLTTYTATAVLLGGTGIAVAAAGLVGDWAFRPHVFIELHDGTVIVREIDTVERDADQDELTFTETISVVDVADIRRVTQAMLVRFNSDEMVETWLNDRVMVTSFETVELLEEKSVTITDLAKLESTDGTTSFDVCTEPVADACDDDPADFAYDLKLVDYVNFEIGTVYFAGETPPPDPGEADGYIPDSSSSPPWNGELTYLYAGVWTVLGTGQANNVSHRGFVLQAAEIEKRPEPYCDYVLTLKYRSSFSPGRFNYYPPYSVTAWQGFKTSGGGPEGFYYANNTYPAIPFSDEHDFFEVRRV